MEGVLFHYTRLHKLLKADGTTLQLIIMAETGLQRPMGGVKKHNLRGFLGGTHHKC